MRKLITKILVATVLVGGSYFATTNANDTDEEFNAPFEKERAKSTADKDVEVFAPPTNESNTPTADKDAKVTPPAEIKGTPTTDKDVKVTSPPTNENATPTTDKDAQPAVENFTPIEEDVEAYTPLYDDVERPITEADIIAALQKEGGTPYPIGQPNTTDTEFFTGNSFVYPISSDGVNVVNVTFAPSCMTFWHVHRGSSQVLSAVAGKGYYQIWGEPVQELLPGDSVTIPEGTKHWHGAQNDSWFQHISIMQVSAITEWLEPVNPNDYKNLNKNS